MRERRRAADDLEVPDDGVSDLGIRDRRDSDSDAFLRSRDTSNAVFAWHAAASFLHRVLLPLDLRGLGIFRILIGLVAVVETLSFIHWHEAILSDSGVCSRAKLLTHKPDAVSPESLQVYFAVAGGLPLLVLLFAHLAVALASMVGFKTRTSLGVLWLFRMGARGRLAHVGYSADGLIVASIFWAAYLPTGKRYSFDAMWSTRQAEGSGAQRAPICSYVLLFELTIMYAFAGYYKTGDAWLEGRAVSQVLEGNMARSHLANLVVQQEWLCTLLCKATLLLERYGWAALFVPHWLPRTLACFAFAGFHLSLWILMQVDLFQPTALALLIGCLPAPMWNLIDGVVASYSKLVFGERDAECLVADETKITGGISDASNLVYLASVYNCHAKRLKRVGEIALSMVAFFLMFLNLRLSCVDFREERPGVASPLFCPAVMLANSWPIEHDMEPLIHFLGVHQKFFMFAPNPPQDFWWLRMSGVTQGGMTVTTWFDGRPNFDWTRNVSSERKRSKANSGLSPYQQRPLVPFATHRWFKLFEHGEFYDHCLQDFGQYMCHSWNARNDGDLALLFFRVTKLWSPLHPPWEPDPTPSAQVISYHACADSHLELVEQLTEPREYTLEEICKHDHRLHPKAQDRSGGKRLPSCRN